jgi:hypothetical protein
MHVQLHAAGALLAAKFHLTMPCHGLPGISDSTLPNGMFSSDLRNCVCTLLLLLQDGKLLPGSKGLSMTGEQWGKLVDGIPGLNAQLGSS